MNKMYVDKDINVFRGIDAEARLTQKNDKQFFEEEIGIRKVTYERWKEAQEYERKTWIEQCRNMSTDRNEDHAKHFNNYKILDSLLNDNISIIELGCGPFTNLRLILPTIKKKINKIDLLDPLILDYVNNMSYCPYKNCMLGFNPVNLIYSPIETYNPKIKYDLVIMINVLEHCFNFDNIWDKIKSMMHKDSVFIFADKFLSYKDLNEYTNNQYDAGHPLRISENYFMHKKQKDFETHYHETFIDEEGMQNNYYILKLK